MFILSDRKSIPLTVSQVSALNYPMGLFVHNFYWELFFNGITTVTQLPEFVSL